MDVNGNVPGADSESQNVVRMVVFVRPDQKATLKGWARARNVSPSEIFRHIFDWYGENVGPLSGIQLKGVVPK